LLQNHFLETTDVARSSLPWTDRYPHAVWRNFVSLELSRSSWLVTSLTPGNGERMSQYSLKAGDVDGLLTRFADLQRKAKQRTGSDCP
jgi:hypothetical protein